VPFLPLQTLWINFTTLLFQAIGLGYGQPAAGLMDRKPRQPDQPILPRALMLWHIIVGLVMGAGTLGVISWAEQAHTRPIAHTMGVVTFSLFALFFSIATRDERRTVFSLETLSDKTFNVCTGGSVLTHRPRAVRGAPQDDQPRPAAMAHLHGRRAVGRRCLRDPESDPPAEGRRGRSGRAVDRDLRESIARPLGG
jgi:magnesium-transporting ATPase (P-type)